jgi:hypothetical protein
MIVDIAAHLQQQIPYPVFPGRVASPGTVPPYISLFLISDIVDYYTGFHVFRIQFSIWAEDYETANEISDRIFNIYQGFSGSMDVYHASFQDKSDLYDPNTSYYGISLDAKFIVRKEMYI